MIDNAEVGRAAEVLLERSGIEPEIGVVLGTGFADAVSNMDVVCEIPYSEVPGMNPSTNPVHPGRFVLGHLFGRMAVAMQGRIHMYEGYTAEQVAFPIFVMSRLGVSTLAITNAAGAINTAYSVEDLVLIRDHINFTGANPLRLSIAPELGTACPDMTYAYSPRLRERVLAAARKDGVELAEGVYIGVLGPSFETPAEIRAFRTMGADLVGMSTVMETIAASSCGIEVLGVSLVTNMAAGVLDERISADDINNVSGNVSARIGKVLQAALS